MKKEINEAVKYICNFSCKYGKLDSNELEHLENYLKDIIEKRYIGHWYEQIPSRGQAYRCICVREDSVDPIFDELFKASGISIEKLGLPNGFTLFIDPGDVSARLNDSYTFSIATFDAHVSSASCIQIATKTSTSSIESYSPSSSSSLSDSGTHTPSYFGDSASERSDTPQSVVTATSLSASPSSQKLSPSSYCGYVESYPYYYKLNRLHHALAIQKAQQEKFKKMIRNQKKNVKTPPQPQMPLHAPNVQFTSSFLRPPPPPPPPPAPATTLYLQSHQQVSSISTLNDANSSNLVDQIPNWFHGKEFIPKSKN